MIGCYQVNNIISGRNLHLYSLLYTCIINSHADTKSETKRHDEPRYSSILLHWVWDRMGVNTNIYCILLFLTFSVLVANPKKLSNTVASPARGLLNREKGTKEKIWQRPPTLLVRIILGVLRWSQTRLWARRS